MLILWNQRRHNIEFLEAHSELSEHWFGRWNARQSNGPMVNPRIKWLTHKFQPIHIAWDNTLILSNPHTIHNALNLQSALFEYYMLLW